MLKSETSWEFLAFNVRPTSSVNEESTTADIGAELVITENAGRGLSATKDFEAGEVIFTEVALILGPAQSVGQHFCASCSQPLSHGVLQGNTEILASIQWYTTMVKRVSCLLELKGT